MRASLKFEDLAPTPSRTGQPAKNEGRKWILKEEPLGDSHTWKEASAFSNSKIKELNYPTP